MRTGSDSSEVVVDQVDVERNGGEGSGGVEAKARVKKLACSGWSRLTNEVC